MKLPGATHLVILGRKIAPRLEGFVSEKIEQWLGLKISRDKTRIYEVKASENGLDFLGYNFSLALAAYGPKRRYWRVAPSKKSVQRETIQLRTMISNRDVSPANFRQQLSRAKADLFQFMENKCGLINPSNPCRCYKKTKGFIREGKVDALTQQFIPKVTETINSVVGQKNEELDDLMEGKYLSLFRSQPYNEENIAEQLVEKLLLDEDVKKLFLLN